MEQNNYDLSLDLWARDAAAASGESAKAAALDNICRMLDGYRSVECIGDYLRADRPAERTTAVLETIAHGLDNEGYRPFFVRHADNLADYLERATPIWQDFPNISVKIKELLALLLPITLRKLE